MAVSSNEVLHAAQYVINNWQTIGAYSVGGVSIATAAHKVERGRGNLSLQKLGYSIVALGSVAGVLANFVLHAHTLGANWHVIPKNLGYLAGPTLFMHKFIVSDSFEAIAGKLSRFSNDIKSLESLEKQAQSPVQPSAARTTITPPNDNQFVG